MYLRDGLITELDIVTQFGYDALGNKTYRIDPEDYIAFVDYDNANRKIYEYFNEAAVYYSPFDVIDTVATKAKATIKTQYEYYDDDKLKSVTNYDYDGTTVLSFSEFTYDDRGRVESVEEKIDDSTNAITNYGYSDTGGFEPSPSDPDYDYQIKITDAKEPTGKDTYISLEFHGKPQKILYPSNDYEELTYYGNGLLDTKAVWDGASKEIIEYDYDDFGKLSTKTYPDTGYLEYTYTDRSYGKFGKVKTITDYRNSADRPIDDIGQTYKFEYDYFWSQRITSYDINDIGLDETDPENPIITNESFTVEYEYSDIYNQKTSVNVYDNSTIGTGEGWLGGTYPIPATNIYRVDYEYDKAGRLTKVQGYGSSDYSYYPDGTLETVTHSIPDDLQVSYEYNPDNALTYIDAKKGNETLYKFNAASPGQIDGLGRLISAKEQIKSAAEQNIGYDMLYAYDDRSQLTSAAITDYEADDWTGLYSYNKDGNIEQRIINAQQDDFTYDGDLMTDIEGDSLTWNNNGQLEEKEAPVSIAFIYNWDDKLRQADFGSDYIKLKYDPLGNRAWKESDIGGQTTTRKYILDIVGKLPVILCEIDPSISDPYNKVKNKYYYTNDGRIVNVSNMTFITDRLGSVRLALSMYGDIKHSYTYTPFGQMLQTDSDAGAPTNNFKFTGQWLDEEIGQYYLRARMYDPAMMRFTTRDPVLGKQQNPLTLHKYLYCMSDPANKIDPDGKFFSIASVLVGNSLYGSARREDLRFHRRIHKKANKRLDGFSRANLERGMSYDLMVDDIMFSTSSRRRSARDKTIWALGAMSDNFSAFTSTLGNQVLGTAVIIADNAEVIEAILTGNATSDDYLDAADSLFEMVTGP
ncbi:RHS repeat domain-containing protein [Planctomycetota bacterium]